jgi:four helix bundle protein
MRSFMGETGDRGQATGNQQQVNGRRTAAGRRPLLIGSDIARRLMLFGGTAIRVSMRLPRDVVGKHVAAQLVRCATSAGANYAEARSAESRADFVHKASVSAKEMRESAYWIGLIGESELLKMDLLPLLDEAEQLAAILGASARRARAGAPDHR